MTCRIDRFLIEEGLVVLRISGRITGDNTVLRARSRKKSGAVAIELGDLGVIDCDAVKVLALSEANGTALRNCPAYIREWIEREREKGSAISGLKG